MNDHPRMAMLLETRPDLVDPSGPERFGLRAIHIAIMLGSFETTKLLLAYGADITATTSAVL